MTRFIVSGMTAFALMAGVAMAQGVYPDSSTSTRSSTTTTTTIIPVAPSVGNYNSSTWQKSIDSNGTEVDKKQTYSNDSNGTTASSSRQTTTSDGVQRNTTYDEKTTSPRGETTSSHTSTTTTGN
jgi:hypothetical protein